MSSMISMAISKQPGSSKLRALLLSGLALLVGVCVTVIPGQAPAHAAFGVIEDEGLAICVNESIGEDRDLHQPITEEDLKRVRLQFRCDSDPGIKSFAGFEGATGVISIFLNGTRHEFDAASDLAALSELPKLRTLYLNGVDLNDEALGGLGGTTRLETLQFANLPDVSDLSWLSNNSNLKTVALTEMPQLSELEPLMNLSGITSLDLSNDAGVSDISALSGMTELDSLTIQSTSVEDLTPLKDLRKLTTLTASHASINSLAPLSEVESLTDLGLVKNNLTSLDGIENLSNLVNVYVSENALSGGIEALANKPNLKRLEIRQTQTTSLAMLANSQALEFLDASDNRIASLQGLPVQNPGVDFHIASQNIHIDEPKQYVPEGATTFRVDAKGQVSLRDGVTFPQLYETSSPPRGPVADPELPLLLFSNIRSDASILDYKFKEGSGYNSFGGNVTMKIVRSSITSGSPDPIQAGKTVTHPVTVTEGFPASVFELGAGAPGWLQINPSTGVITGKAPAAGEYEVEVRVADKLGNTINGSITITVIEGAPELEESVISIGADQRADAGDDLAFIVTRENASENAWTGEASVTVATVDGTAVSGVDYEAVTETLVWAADDTTSKVVKVNTAAPVAGAAASEKTFIVALSSPGENTVLGGRAAATGTVIIEEYAGGVAPPAPDAGINLAHTGVGASNAALFVGAALVLAFAGGLLLWRRPKI